MPKVFSACLFARAKQNWLSLQSCRRLLAECLLSSAQHPTRWDDRTSRAAGSSSAGLHDGPTRKGCKLSQGCFQAPPAHHFSRPPPRINSPGRHCHLGVAMLDPGQPPLLAQRHTYSTPSICRASAHAANSVHRRLLKSSSFASHLTGSLNTPSPQVGSHDDSIISRPDLVSCRCPHHVYIFSTPFSS